MARASVPALGSILQQAAGPLLACLEPEEQPAEQRASPIWVPNAGAQTRAYESLADELFYGGAGGGGKTDLLLGLAFTQHRSSIIFRREFTQFRGSLGMIERSEEIAGLHGSLNRSLFLWTGLPGNRALEFGAVKTRKDREKYRGRPHDFKGFDELPEFLEDDYRFLIGWLRTAYPNQRVRVVGAGNPPSTPEGEWVNAYWGPWLDRQHPNPAKDGELRWFVSDAEGKDLEVPGPTEAQLRAGARRPMAEVKGKMVEARSRTFIKARVEDNPIYMATGYDKILDSLPEPLRSQLRHGDFGVSAEDHPWQVIPTAWVIAAQERWTKDGHGGRPLDMAGCDPSRGGVDEFVNVRRHANWVAELDAHKASEAPDGAAGAALVFKDVRGNRVVPIQIDIIGTAGASVYDHARGLGLNAVAMNGSEASEQRDKSGKIGFVNMRAEWHWRMREMLDPSSGEDLALPPDHKLRSDLCAARWRPTARGIQVEAKEDIKKRLGRSPDRGDAVINACIMRLGPKPKAKPKAAALW